MTDKPCRITIAAYRTHAEGGTQIQIIQLDANGTGWGRRLAGPKHHNAGTTTLVERDLDADDAREIRSMLDAAFPPAPLPAGFTAHSCIEVACAAPGCGYRYDEDEFVGHHDSAEEATSQVVGSGWAVLPDGRVVCPGEDEDHDALRVLAAAPATEDGAL